jgi:hypothetical protein
MDPRKDDPSEALIRHIEIVGRLPQTWKQLIVDGYSTRRVVASWRDEQRRQRRQRAAERAQYLI